jgi:glycine cleavage system H lipoate-binding protein
MAKLLNVNPIEIDCIKVGNVEELISAIQNDPYSIGICKMINYLDFGNQSTDEGIELLPVDRNGNGKIDYMEKIYDDFNVFSRGVWIGKYPKSLFSNIYFISPVKPTGKTEVAFLKFVLTDGQQLLGHNGYSTLLLSERQSKVDLISGNKVDIITSDNNHPLSKAILIILASFVVLFFLLKIGVRYIRSRKAYIKDTTNVPVDVLDEDFAYIPLGLYFDKTHTWAFMEKDGLVKIGIDDFLQHITGPLTRIKMKSIGERIRKGRQVLSIIQNGKQLNVYAPISGTIKEQNKLLNENSSMINSSPYSEGWVYKIEPTNWLKEIQYLIMGKKYKEWLKSEFSRLKEFLTISVNPENLEYAPILQDGGEIKDGILSDLGPEVWEDFQTNFIDMSS